MRVSDSFRKELLALGDAAIRAAMPGPALRAHVHADGGKVVAGLPGGPKRSYDFFDYDRVMLLGAGKAAASMAETMEDLLGERLDFGLVVTKYGHALNLGNTEVMEAAHPVPDRAGVRGAETLLAAARDAGKRDLVFFLLSGGASALVPAPAPGLTLEDKQTTTRLLLEAGATINELNAVRKHLSIFKGGQLARALYPAETVSLIISDVVGSPLDVIGSGPAAPDSSTYGECAGVLEKYSIMNAVPPAVRERISDGAAGRVPETPKAGDVIFDNVFNLIIADNRAAVDSAAQAAREAGYTPRVLTSEMEGEARDVARELVSAALDVLHGASDLKPPACLLAGGETTVTIRGRGLGGRNQELALAAAVALDRVPEAAGRIALMSLGTDGTDGPVDAAGGLALSDTLERARSQGFSAEAALRDNDSHHFLKAAGDLVITGPTRTNVMDVVVVLVK